MRLIFEDSRDFIDDRELIGKVFFYSIEEAELLHAGKEPRCLDGVP